MIEIPKNFPLDLKGFNPFGDLIGLRFSKYEHGSSQCVLDVSEKLLNPHKVLHGGVLYSMADTGMGAALYSHLKNDELCATVEIKISYFAAVKSGKLTCDTKVLHKGKRIAILESEITSTDRPIAKATGTFSIFKIKRG